MTRLFTFSFSHLKAGLLAIILLPVLHLNATNTIALGDLLDVHGKLTNPLLLEGTVDFSGYYPVIDECEGLIFLPPPLAPGWNALGSGVNSSVQAIAISGSNVYVGG